MKKVLLIVAVAITAVHCTLELVWAWIPVVAAQLSLSSSADEARAVLFWAAVVPLIYTASTGEATWIGIGLSAAVGATWPDPHGNA